MGYNIMAKEITAEKAREIAEKQIPKALWDKIFTNISDMANKGQKKILIDLDGYFGIYSEGRLDPLFQLLCDKLEELGYTPNSPQTNPNKIITIKSLTLIFCPMWQE